MSFSTNLARGLQKSLGNLWKNDDFSDFTVMVDDTSFQCHRFILSACSGFFQGLFRSQMKECQENCATIGGMDANIFEVILNSLYKGIDGLTKDNFLNVWSATEQLQIRYLTEECENFAINNTCVDNVSSILNHAIMYSAEKVVTHALHFISEHFSEFRNTESFLLLKYDFCYRVIHDDNLNIKSEDEVVESVMKWAAYTDNLQQQQTNASSDNVDNTNTNNVEIDDSAIFSDLTASKASDNSSTELCRPFTIQENRKNSMDGNNVASSCQDILPAVDVCGSQTLINDIQSMILTGTENNQTGILKCTKETNTNKCAANMPGQRRKEGQNIILKYIHDVSEDRRQHLFKLISACRFYLLSSTCLDTILHNRLLVSCEEAYNMILEAVMYNMCVERRHDTWPEAAVHRMSSNMKHVMVYKSGGKLMAYNLNRGTIHEVTTLPDNVSHPSIVVSDNSLFLDHGGVAVLSMLTKNKTWRSDSVNVWNSQQVSKSTFGSQISPLFVQKSHLLYKPMLAHKCYLYCVSCYNQNSYSLDCYNDDIRVWLPCCTFNTRVNLLVRFHNYILAFYDENHDDKYNYATALCYNTINEKTYNSSEIMDGTSEDMISFSHQGDVFVLQKNGSLWKILSTDNGNDDDADNTKMPMNFELVTKLWDFVCELKGCLVYKKQLYVFYQGDQKFEPVACLTTITGVFNTIKFGAVQSDTSCLPMIIPEQWLTQVFSFSGINIGKADRTNQQLY